MAKAENFPNDYHQAKAWCKKSVSPKQTRPITFITGRDLFSKKLIIRFRQWQP